MLSYRQIGRKLSNRLRRTTSELYSANDSIDDATLDKVKEEADQVIWQEEQQGVNSNIVSGTGAVSASFATVAPFSGTFTINAAALPSDAFDINSDRPTTPKWLQVKVGM